VRSPPVLRSRNFRLLFAGQAVSVLGDALFPVALVFAVLDLGGSPAELGLVLAAQGLPLAVLILAAGVWADRVPRQRIMLISDIGRGGAQAVAAWLLLSGRAEIWHLAVLSAVYGAFEAGFRPAAGGLVPQIVDSEHLQQANALMGLALNLGFVLGPAAAGALTAGAGPGFAIALDAGTFAISSVFLLFLRVPRPRREETTDAAGRPAGGFLAELKGGVAEVRRRRWMWTFMPGMSAYHLIALPALLALGPVVANRELGGAAAWGIITSGFGVGTIIGNLIALRVQPKRPMLVAATGFVFAATQPIIVALGGTLPVIAALMVLGGIAVSFAFGQWETTLGREIPEHALARVTSLDYFVTAGMMPLGYAVVGLVSALAGTKPTMVAAGVAVMALCAAALTVPDIRGLRRRVTPAPPQESIAS
jgi:predicted MFS family arabinose efflux permease